MKNILWVMAIFAAFTSCSSSQHNNAVAPFLPNYPLNRFESTIREYEHRDSLQFPGNDNFVFGGSSSIFFWKTLSNDMQPLKAVNYGFGGSTFPEVNFYAERTILKNHPKAIVIYCENDLYGAQPKTPEQVLADYQKLIKTIRKKLPHTPVCFIALKPSPSRWARWAESAKVNQLISAYIKTQKHQEYIDIVPCMLKNGRPDPFIFLADSLHMNAAGYARWTEIIKPTLQKMR